jgi:hypothetical protein
MTSDATSGPSREDVLRRLERFFRLSDLRCSDCGGWLSDPPEEFDIADEGDWDDRMGAEVAWVLNNRRAVLDALPAMDPEWAECCESVRFLVRQSEAVEALRRR